MLYCIILYYVTGITGAPWHCWRFLPVPDRDDRLVASTNTVMCFGDFSGTDVLSEMDGRKMIAF